MAYQAIPPVSSGGGLTPTQENAVAALVVDPRAAALARARALLGTTINRVLGNDIDGSSWYTGTTSGTGAVTPSTTAKAGVVTVSTGATSTGLAHIRPASSTGIAMVDNPRTSLWYVVARLKLNTAMDAQALCSLRLYTASGGNPQTCWGVNGSVSTTNWSFNVLNGGGSTVASGDSGVAFDTNYHTLEMWNDATDVHFALDQTELDDTASTNIATNSSTPAVLVYNGTTSAVRSIDVDYMFICVVGN